jgi:hypothetical protein
MPTTIGTSPTPRLRPVIETVTYAMPGEQIRQVRVGLTTKADAEETVRE